MAYFIKINKRYSYKRRIPEQYRHLYPASKEYVKTSLKTDSAEIAKQRAQLLNSALEEIWRDSALSGKNTVEDKYNDAVRYTRMSGFKYRSSEEISEGKIEDIISRILNAKDNESYDPNHVPAILGIHEKPEYPISKALDDFMEFSKPNLRNKTEDQVRKWKNPRKKAVNNFISVCQDKHVETYTREDMLLFRKWWFEKIEGEDLAPQSANKDFGFVGQILSYARDDKNYRIDVRFMMEKIRFTETESTRLPFETGYIFDTLLNPENLSGLHDECRLFLYAMADTGARPAELVGLNPIQGDIRLDCDIPFIHIRAGFKKELKTPQSDREIPLVGAALYAFKKMPQGFQHYYRKPDQLSANLNKFLRDHDLLPSQDHSVYSLRHSFEDRLTAVEPPDKIQAALMGHKYQRERYGKGPTLEQKKKWLDKIAFDIH